MPRTSKMVCKGKKINPKREYVPPPRFQLDPKYMKRTQYDEKFKREFSEPSFVAAIMYACVFLSAPKTTHP